jgi:isoaspartyl peptidase/L-asparaginase-like protein (Ntn-hydrolase superfamily)
MVRAMRTLTPYLALTLASLLAVACRDERPVEPPASATQATPTASASSGDGGPREAQTPSLPKTPWKAAAIAHGGVGSPPGLADGCRAAVDAALAALEAGADPLDAAVAGVVVLEDDPRFNAGTGSRVRIDGVTVQMDASVMDSAGRFGAVAVLEGVKNPVKVARAVVDTPHLLLAGDGATRFARSLGMPLYDPATPEMKAKTAAIQEQLRRGDPSLPASWRDFQWRSRWNFERTLEESGLAEKDAGSDTVGVVVRASDGRFAGALSTGGTSITLRGRVGDVPIYGAGLFAGRYGAAAATGKGERIIEAGLARAMHTWMEAGASPTEAAARAVRELREKGEVGVIVIGPEGLAAMADRAMAWAARTAGESAWIGPEPGDAGAK